MRLLRLAAYLSLCFPLSLGAQEPPASAMRPSPLRLRSPAAETTAPVDPTQATPDAAADTGAILDNAWGLRPSSFRVDFIYWEARDPRENGPVLSTDSTDPSSPLANGGRGFSTGEPNTDPEGGIRLFYSRPWNDLISLELGGFWTQTFDYGITLRGGQRLDQNGQVVFDDVFLLAPNDVSLDVAILKYELRSYGIEANTRTLLYENDRLHVDGIVGLRYTEYYERFGIEFTPTNRFPVTESVETENSYFGPQIGAEAKYYLFDYVTLRGLFKLGMTANFQDVNYGGPAIGSGLFTGRDNIGTHPTTDYATVIDASVGLVFHLTPNLQVYGSYDFLFLDTAYRAMDQLDLFRVTRADVQRPRVTSDVMLNGFSCGIELTY